VQDTVPRSLSDFGSNTRPAGDRLVRSSHLRLSEGTATPYAYHTLFGNFAWVDAQLRDLLPSIGQIRFSDLVTIAGRDTAELLRDSYFFVESEDEERSLVTEWLAERRQTVHTGRYVGALQISSSNSCNFGCSYCFADASDRRSAPRQQIADGPQNISHALASTAIRTVRDVARRNGRQRIGVKFLGREPMINWKVIRLLMEEFSDNVQWSITTNGSLITPDIAADLRRFGVLTVVSVDGPAAIHDAFRTYKAGGGTFPKVANALSILADAGTPYGVSSVVTSQSSLAAMHPFIDFIVGRGARELELTLAMQTRHVPDAAVSADASDLAYQLADLYDAARERLLVHGDWVDPFHRILSTHKFRDEDIRANPVGSACTATSHQISLEPSGDLFPCRAMSTHYGTIFDLPAALHSRAYEDVVMRTFFNVPACRGCQLEGFCQGTCLGSSEELAGDVYAIDESYCRVYRAVTDVLLARHAARRGTDA
jgi:uncharacterized protein